MICLLIIERKCLLSLTEHCDYRYQLQDMLRERLVYGIKHERIQQHLMSQGDSLTRGQDIAHSMDSAIHSSNINDEMGILKQSKKS